MPPVKRYAYEAYFKLQAIEYAAENGNRAAARHFNVNESMRLPADYQERVAIFRTYYRDKITAPSHIYEAAAGKLYHHMRIHPSIHPLPLIRGRVAGAAA
ncbi:hypothetical protein D4764_01G0015360 [Takifugu flavidus]|uniref:Uncharacterized protein n=1 Tax=Takifugu flavidus TaxID=433684 RepID=A0A5C6PSI9_9TELE|nr:hypothetical protein D4764_01G0015360 [Takifugu flavidus]